MRHGEAAEGVGLQKLGLRVECRTRTGFEVQVDHLAEVEVVEALGDVGGDLSPSAEQSRWSGKMAPWSCHCLPLPEDPSLVR